MIKILANDKIDDQSVQALKDLNIEVTEEHYDPEALKEKIKDFDGIIVRSATKLRKEVLKSALESGKLKLIIRAGVGIDNIDKAFAEEKGITVKNTPDASTTAVGELVLGHMLSLARHLHQSNVTMRKGKWMKKQYTGMELEGKTLGIIGFGRMGRAAAEKAYGIGMKVAYTKRSGPVEGYEHYQYLSKEALLKNADVISIHAPYNPKVGAILDEKAFDMMKDGVYVINCARGGVLSEDALLKALDSGKVAAAALDVFEDEPLEKEEIYNHEKISLSPHIGAATTEAQEKIGEEIIKIAKEFFDL
ncbi:D-2-hydroxyacid dehydrogenase [Isachenkonia alkalipeptolytica]|uniref:3-phosphoglycerate dehydrogenase n=1 Tax=Isachenkonia alkalipeptolytica TaxID=2565777 RepID=A0AA43XJW8_9CLOT|nr:D-2-hydroxyacid dehydrogenase [Isachenkonia alkalipeptolytica]NBG88270.1 3-phosphoglycerate dehydrogenase [Isachenkonia alkalipeptolytica]